MQRNKILHGDAWQLAKSLPDESINCVISSPPYFNQRDYGTAQWEGGNPECDHVADASKTKKFGNPEFNVNRPSREATKGEGYYFKDVCGKCGAKRVDAQFGLESTPEDFVDKLVSLFRELRRALRHDGTVWLNLGSSYAGSGGAGGDYNEGGLKAGQPRYNGTGKLANFKPKDMIPIPWMVAMALQADGWWLRQDIIWHKRAPMPSSVTDRCTTAHEYVFLLSKSPRYFYDAEAIKEPVARVWDETNMGVSNGWVTGEKAGHVLGRKEMPNGGLSKSMPNPAGANRRSVWTLGPEQFPGNHFAVMPSKLVRPMILAGCPAEVCAACGAPVVRVVEKTKYEPEVVPAGIRNVDDSRVDKTRKLSGSEYNRQAHSVTTGFRPTCTCDAGTVPGITLDPFMGSGTTAVVARSLGRDWIGFELNADYIKLAEQRIGKTQPPLFAA